MVDIEKQSRHTSIMSLRKRKNQHSIPTTTAEVGTLMKSHQQNLRQHAKLVREINNATDSDDEDDEAKQMKQMIMKYQQKTNDQMANSFFRLLKGILIVLMLLYSIVIFFEPTDEPSVMNSLVKVIRILLGMKRDRINLASSRIVASTTIPTSTIDNFLIPIWPWQRRSSSTDNYLVPVMHTPVKHILHQSMKLKKNRGINIDLFDEGRMREFLMEYGHECSDEQGNINDKPLIVQKFDDMTELSIIDNNNGPKNLWLWCMIYSGETFGHLDIDNYMIEMTPNFLRKLSLGNKQYGIENVLINPSVEYGDHNSAKGPSLSLLSLSTSILFVSNAKSKVSEGMLQFMLSSSYDEEELHEELMRLVHSAGGEKEEERLESWTILNAHCTTYPTDTFNDEMLARVCRSNKDREDDTHESCCYLVL